MKIKSVAAVGTLVLMVSCGLNTETTDTSLPSERPKTVVLTEFADDTILDYSELGTLTINTAVDPPVRIQDELGTMKVDEPAKVKVGNIIVSAPTKKLPNGLLRKVKSVSKNSDGTAKIETDQATLAEEIAGADLKKEDIGVLQTAHIPVYVMRRDEIDTQNLPDILSKEYSGSLKPQAEFDIFNLGKKCFSPSVGTATNQLTADNCVSFRAWLDVKIDIGWNWIFPYLAGFGATINAAGNISVSQSLSADLKYEPKLPTRLMKDIVFYDYGIYAPPAVMWLGPLPIVIIPVFSLKGGLFDTYLTYAATGSVVFNSKLLKLDMDIGTPRETFDPVTKAMTGQPLKYGFYCGNTNNAAKNNWGCTEVSTVNWWIDKIKSKEYWSKQEYWDGNSSPLVLDRAGIGLSASISTRMVPISFSGGIYLFGVLGVDAAAQPYLQPTLSLNATYPLGLPAALTNVQTTLSGDAIFGMNGYTYMRAQIFGIPLVDAKLVDFDQTIASINIFNRCWIGTTPCQK